MTNSSFTIKIFSFLLFLNTSLLAQKDFLPGQITKANGETIDVLVKMTGWKNNPYSIQYKLENEDKITLSTAEDIAAFEVFNKAKYISAKVAFDRSSDLLEQLSYVKEPLWENESLFMKVLLESELSLFLHKTNNTTRFYYQNGQSNPLEPLVYKKYQVNQRIKHNRSYRKQIQDNFTCGYDIDGLRTLQYKIKDLVKTFVSINECTGNEVNIIQSEKLKGSTIWAFQTGFKFISGSMTRNSSATLVTTQSASTSDIESKTSLVIGFEGEYMLPRSINKWSLFFGASYSGFNTEGRLDGVFSPNSPQSGGPQTWDGMVHSITSNIGFRRHLHVNDNLRFLLSLAWAPGFRINLSSGMDVNGINPVVSEGSNFNAGFGIQKGLTTLETKYHTRRRVLKDSDLYDLNYQGFSILLSFKFKQEARK